MNELAKYLKRAQHIVVTSHIFPDGDNVGAILSLGEALRTIGKRVQVVLDDQVPKPFRFLPGVDRIEAPAQIESATDCLIVLDCSDVERTGCVYPLVQERVTVLNLDHHISNTGFGHAQFVDAQASSTCELVFELIRCLDVEITPTMALNLYTGIATDCGFFKYASTSPKTHRIAAQLLATGVDPTIVSDAVETRSRSGMQLLINVLNTLTFACNGKLACLRLSSQQTEGLNMQEENTEGFVNFARYIDGVEVAALLRQTETGTKVSLRSRNQIDVSKLAFSMGGGGHKRAAGYSASLDIDATQQQVAELVAQELAGYER